MQSPSPSDLDRKSAQAPARWEDAPVNILLVDDERSNLSALEAVLDDPRYRLVRAASGEEALRALIAEEFACLLLDVQMPGMTGFELARIIGGRRKSARTPIIFLSAHYLEDEHALEGYATGAVDYLPKPFRPEVLRQKVEVFAALHRIIRDQRQLAQDKEQLEIARSKAAAQDAKRRREALLGMLAHELRNPLAPIANAVAVIRSPVAPRRSVDRACDVIARQADRLARLIDGVLDVAGVMQGEPLQREVVTLAAVVARAAESSAAGVRQRQQELAIELPAEPIEVHGDPERLGQVVSSLLHNASKFSQPGATIRLTATWTPPEVRICVRDAGQGMTADFLPHAFDLFAQEEQSLDRPHGGFGLGLALVRHIVDLHGGRVLARSDGPGLGTEVVVYLPAQPGTAATRRVAPIRVLVVDDETASAETLMALLEVKGFEVRIAHDGEGALREAEGFLPDAVLLDIGMPGMSGFEVAQQLRKQAHASVALLVALTGYGDAGTRSRAAAAGFDSHMTKPADLDRLLAMLADPNAARQQAHGT